MIISQKGHIILFKLSLTFLLFLFSSDIVVAETNSGDTAWILSSSALVLFMTLPGLALFYGGLVQSKNILSVLCQHFGVACLMSVLWVVIGYSLAFSQGTSGLIGSLDKMFISLDENALVGTIPEILFVMFQMTFCIITPALIIGSYVERIKFSVVLIFSSLWLLIVYCRYNYWVLGWWIFSLHGRQRFCWWNCCSHYSGCSGYSYFNDARKRKTLPLIIWFLHMAQFSQWLEHQCCGLDGLDLMAVQL